MRLPALPVADAKAMLEDPDWPLPEGVRRRITVALAPLASTEDWSEFRHELQGYREFCRYRSRLAGRSRGNGSASRDLLEARRKRIRARIQARRFLEARGPRARWPAQP